MDRTPLIREWLKEVYDPELGVNIVDLGLVFDIRDQGNSVFVQMTLTTPGCPMHDTIVGGVRRVLEEQLGINEVEVELVWEPRWSPHMMSEEAKRELGF
ncbi:metal-sulfur cluster assembly factor [Paenibacillus sp. DYY-L-2]|uniref:metal-sulfur cluster assembly factor n=1 Tax=Paenibacillus sp. DYY-L-2 TaxID=3447013 RepID=UPI003F50C822